MQSRPGTLVSLQTPEALAAQLQLWCGGVGEEVDFWDDWLKTRGSEWPEDFTRRLEDQDAWPEGRLPVPEPHWKILDVGAGPATRLHKTVKGHTLDITAVDPLAPFYKRCRQRAGYKPPIETEQAFAEDLTAIFEPNTFDLTNMQNAMDHSRDPLRAIEEMILVTKVGGAVVLTHALDEAVRGDYGGLHQWNFNSQDGKFRIWNKSFDVIVDPIFEPFARFETTLNREINEIKTIIWKLADLPIDLAVRRKQRLENLLNASLIVMRTNAEQPLEKPASQEVPAPQPTGLLQAFRRAFWG